MTSDLAAAVRGRLEAQCAKREYCVSDVRAKAAKALSEAARKAGEEPDDIRSDADAIVSKLIADGYVSDLRYASAFAREKASLTGWGPVKIRFALSAKGISREVIDSALGEIDSDKADGRLERLLAAKARTLEGDPQAKLKLLKFALSRGYEYDAVSAAVDAALK